MRTVSTKRITLAQVVELRNQPNADLLLIKPVNWDYQVIKFQSRKALEAFNKKAGLKAVFATQVPLNCAIYAHESDSEARKELK